MIRKARSECLFEIVKPKRTFGHDIAVYIGKHRFIKHRTIEQIIKRLSRKYGITISQGEVSYQSKRFLISLKCLHDLNAEKLLSRIEQQGGYILHIDGTSAEDSDHLFAALDGISGFVLLSSRIRSENKKELVEILNELKERFGEPLLIIKDMAQGVENACREVFPFVAIVECHFHFCRDVGLELFDPYYSEFRKLMNDLKLKLDLKRILKGIQSTCKEHGYHLKSILKAIAAGKKDGFDKDALTLALIYDNVQKTLKNKRDRTGLGLPFDLPLVDLYRNCLVSAPLIRRLLITYAQSDRMNPLLHRLDTLLKGLSEQPTATARRLSELNHMIFEVSALFSKLRTILRLRCNGRTPLSDPLPSSLSEQQAIHKDLTTFKQALRKELDQVNCPLQREKQIIFDHLARHLDKLELPVIEIWDGAGVRVLDLSRTNNLVEQHFRFLKRSGRKRHGRSDIGLDLNEYGPYLSYVENLGHDGYLESMFKSWDGLVRAFSSIPDSVYLTAEVEYDDVLKTPIRPFQLGKGFDYLFSRGLTLLEYQIDLEKYGGGSMYRPMVSPTDV